MPGPIFLVLVAGGFNNKPLLARTEIAIAPFYGFTFSDLHSNFLHLATHFKFILHNAFGLQIAFLSGSVCGCEGHIL